MDRGKLIAIDTVDGYVMEVNIANPGGLGTLAALYGEEPVKQRMGGAIETLAIERSTMRGPKQNGS